MLNILSKIKYLIDPPEISYKTIMEDRPTDYQIVTGMSDGKLALPPENIPNARHKFSGIQYHQPNVSNNSCSIHAPFGALSDLTGTTFTISEIKKVWEQMKADGYASEEWGGYGWYAVDMVRKHWNTICSDDQIVSLAVETGTPLYYKLLEKGYSIVHGYRWIDGYDQDWSYNRVLDKQWDSDIDEETYGTFLDGGHYLRTAISDVYNVLGNNIIDIDNYNQNLNRIRNDNNIYGIKKEIISELCNPDKRIWHEWGYVYMFKKDIEEASLIIDTKLLERLNNRVIYNPDKDKFAIIKNGKAIELKGKHMSELFAHKWLNTNESYVLGLNSTNWHKIGLK